MKKFKLFSLLSLFFALSTNVYAISNVSPGDEITSSKMNEIVTQVNKNERKVQILSLPATAGVAITRKSGNPGDGGLNFDMSNPKHEDPQTLFSYSNSQGYTVFTALKKIKVDTYSINVFQALGYFSIFTNSSYVPFENTTVCTTPGAWCTISISSMVLEVGETFYYRSQAALNVANYQGLYVYAEEF